MKPQLAPGMRVVIRDEEWLIRRADPAKDGGYLLSCDGISELVRGQESLFLTELEDAIEILDPANDPIKGFGNLMYTMHFYAGTHKQWLRDRTDEAIAKGLPVFVSECAAMEASGDGPIDSTEWKLFKNWMDRKQLSWIAWSVSDKKETCSVLLPSAKSRGKWKEEDIKEWGRLARKELQAYK